MNVNKCRFCQQQPVMNTNQEELGRGCQALQCPNCGCRGPAHPIVTQMAEGWNAMHPVPDGAFKDVGLALASAEEWLKRAEARDLDTEAGRAVGNIADGIRDVMRAVKVLAK